MSARATAGVYLRSLREFAARTEELAWSLIPDDDQGGILVQSVLGRLVRRFGEPSLVAAGFASMAVGYGLLAGVHVLPLLLVAGVFSSFGTGVLRPSLTSLGDVVVSPISSLFLRTATARTTRSSAIVSRLRRTT